MEKCTSIVALIKSPPLLLVSREKRRSTPSLYLSKDGDVGIEGKVVSPFASWLLFIISTFPRPFSLAGMSLDHQTSPPSLLLQRRQLRRPIGRSCRTKPRRMSFFGDKLLLVERYTYMHSNDKKVVLACCISVIAVFQGIILFRVNTFNDLL